MKDEWKIFTGWLLLVIILLLSDCNSAPIDKQVIRHGVIDYYELIEPLGTKHLYREEPIVNEDKIYYCLIHESTEIIYRLDSDSILTKRIRRWSIIR